MLPDTLPIEYKYPDRPDLTIYAVGDVHIGSQQFRESLWQDFVKRVTAEENSRIVIVGDLIDNVTRSSVGSVFESTIRPSEQKKLAANYLAPLREKILCAVPGNHEARSGKDSDDSPLYDILAKIDLEDVFRENEAFVKICMGKQNGDGAKNPTYTIHASHGAGGGALTGGTVNRKERFAYTLEGIDVFFTGHDHKPFSTFPCRRVFDAHNMKIKEKPCVVLSCTSWLAYGGYSAQKMLPPTSFAPNAVILKGMRKEIEYRANLVF